MKILLTVSYDGTNYHGWQRQKDKITVAGEIERCLEKIYKEKIKIIGASRTDAGVHALDQKTTFSVHHSNIPPDKLKLVLNRILPLDIRVLKSEEVSQDFHPILHSKSKTYRYTIYNGNFDNPLNRLYSIYVDRPLNFKEMELAANEFVGTYDFVGFCATGSSQKDTIRTIYNVNMYKEKDFIYFEITGNGFLYNMVRTIVGTLIDVGLGKISSKDIKHIINSKNRKLSSKTVQAKGLTLIKVNFLC